MAAIALIVGILSSVFSIGHTAYLLSWDMTRQPNTPPAMTAPQHRQMIDMTPVESNRSLGGR